MIVESLIGTKIEEWYNRSSMEYKIEIGKKFKTKHIILYVNIIVVIIPVLLSWSNDGNCNPLTRLTTSTIQGTTDGN